MATRIQARAIRRCGELLKEFEPAKNQHDASTAAGTSRKQAAEEAGLSKRQKDTALRVATVPEEEFEAQIESDSPPTVTALAEQGTQKKVFDPFDLMDSGISFEDGVWGATEPGTQLSLKPQHLKLNPHTLRHTHGYQIIQAGGHLGDVMESLGSRLDQVFDEICQAGSGRKRGAT